MIEHTSASAQAKAQAQVQASVQKSASAKAAAAATKPIGSTKPTVSAGKKAVGTKPATAPPDLKKTHGEPAHVGAPVHKETKLIKPVVHKETHGPIHRETLHSVSTSAQPDL